MTTRNALLFSGGCFQPQARPSSEPVLDSSSEQRRRLSQPAVSHYLRYPSERTFSDNCLGTEHPALWPRQQTQLGCRYSAPPAQYKERFVVRCRCISRAARADLDRCFQFVTLRSASNCKNKATAELEARDTRTGIAPWALVMK